MRQTENERAVYDVIYEKCSHCYAHGQCWNRSDWLEEYPIDEWPMAGYITREDNPNPGYAKMCDYCLKIFRILYNREPRLKWIGPDSGYPND